MDLVILALIALLVLRDRRTIKAIIAAVVSSVKASIKVVRESNALDPVKAQMPKRAPKPQPATVTEETAA